MPEANGDDRAGPRAHDRSTERLWERFDPMLVILSPPRCGSTVVARSFWQHPRFRWYVHEPYDSVYHRGDDRDSVRAAVSAALEKPGRRPAGDKARGAVVKEMTFQVGPLLPELVAAATLPVLVTIRDPRLAVRSRMRQLERSGQDPCFPEDESGWAALEKGLSFLREQDVPYVVAEVTELRRRPAAMLNALCHRLGLSFSPEMLSWPSAADLAFGRLDDEQRHWYTRVLTSTGFQAPTEVLPGLDDFPVRNGMRAHVATCLDVYRRVLDGPG